MKAHLVGGGLASLAAAAHLIKDGGILANNIFIYERSDDLGGAMGMAGGPVHGYVLPTGRVFENEYRCAFELFSLVPSVGNPQKSIKDEILEFNARYGYYDKAHVIDLQGEIVKSAHFGLSVRNRLDLLRLTLTPEELLEGKRIDEFLSPDFFESEFWFLWAPLMGSLPQHSAMEMRRFICRFLHLLPDLSEMTKILRTRYNQHEAIVQPICEWLRKQGVNFLTGALVTDISFQPSTDKIAANSLEYVRQGNTSIVDISQRDLVLVTIGSQVADVSIGSMTAPPVPRHTGQSWALWERLARGRPEFGNPGTFFGKERIGDSKWMTFTATTTDPIFFDLMRAKSGSEPGRGGLMTFKDSNWLITLAIFHQPEFLDQPENVMVWWGFGITPDNPGNFVQKAMSECSGAEILEEVLRHAKFDQNVDKIIASTTCIPCVLPYAGSVWTVRGRSDRPQVVPKGSTNLGFMGQFAEIPLETAFTMEYSVRSAREAITQLLNLKTKPPPVYQGQHHAEVLLNALKALS